MKKIIAMTLTLAMALCLLAGCDGAKLSAYEIYNKSVKKQAELEGISMLMDVNVDMTVSGESIPMQMTINANAAGDSAMEMSMLTKAVMDGETTMEIPINMILADGVLYYDMSAVYEGMKFTIPFDKSADALLDNAMSNYEAQLTEMDFDDAAVTKNSDGTTTVALKLKGETLDEFIAGFSESFGSNIGIDISDAEVSMGDITYDMTFDKDYLMTGLNLEMSVKVTAEGETIDMVMSMTSQISELEAGYKISAPADADSYMDGGDYGLTADDFVSAA